jgi:pimeloyl-ACP methyl ester carboxylesterase
VKSPRHFTCPPKPWRRWACVAALGIAACSAGVESAAAQTTASRTFRVFVRGVDMGIEEVTVMESVDGWTLRGSGKLRAPVNLAMDYWEARYDRAWKPIELTINLTESAKQWTVRTTFQGTTASSDITQDGQTQRRTSAVATDTIVLPNLIFGAYEALAARLASEKVGSQLQVFIAPQDALSATIHNVTDETIKLPGRIISARRWTLHLGGGSAKLEMDVWTEGSRLLRVDIPTQMLTVLRDDIASVSARLVTLARPNDEEVSIPANGFSLAATISRPVATPEPAPTPGRKPAPVRLPAVVLISGSAPTDREEFVAGIPIFAQLANALADAGYLVVRYDERGAGLSGGRQESATIEEFAVDARAVVTYLMKRRDVDPKKVSLVGYGEGGWIALLVAAREQKIAAIALIATPSTPGTELVLEQQRLMFERGTTTSPAVQQAAIDQQKKILEAVVTGKGWENFNPDMRKRVDTPLYRSFLMFEPAAAIVKVRQPMLVVQPMLDREVPAYHGEQLAQLARSRPRAGPTAFVQLTGVNHLLARATTGEIAEYGTLTQRSVSPAATLELTSWLAKALVPERSK